MPYMKIEIQKIKSLGFTPFPSFSKQTKEQ